MLLGRGGTGGELCPNADLALGIRLGDDGVFGRLLGLAISLALGDMGLDVGVFGRGIRDGVSHRRAEGDTARSRSG